MEKLLPLICTKKTYVDPSTKVSKQYWSYEVDCNGIRVPVKPEKGLGYQLLNHMAETAEDTNS